MYLSDEAFLESRSVRDQRLAEIPNEQAEDVLNRAKALLFAVWQGQGIATTEQVAEFYSVDTEAIQKVVQRNRDELSVDGLRVLRGKDLKDVMDIMSISSRTPNLTVWTPRAALRLGMLLRDSAVAKQIRSLLIEMVAQGRAESPSERELTLQIELQRLRQQYQDTGWEIVKATSPAMLAFIRGERPLVRTEIQYVDKRTGEPLGTTTYRILPQLVEDAGLQRNSEKDQQIVKDILRRERGVDWETGAGLGPGFMIACPLVIPEELYEDYLYLVAKDLYGDHVLAGWSYEQQLLPAFLKERGIFPGDI